MVRGLGITHESLEAAGNSHEISRTAPVTLLQKLGIDLPIIQAPMAGVSSPASFRNGVFTLPSSWINARS